MLDTSPVSNFVVRVWREGTHQGAPAWRVQIDHVQSGRQRTFGDLDEVTAFIRDCLETPPSGG